MVNQNIRKLEDGGWSEEACSEDGKILNGVKVRELGGFLKSQIGEL